MTGDAGLGGSSQPPKRRTGRAARPRLRGHLGSPAGVQARGPRRQLRRAAKLRGWRARGRRGGGGAAGRGDRGSAATSARAPRLRFRVRPPAGRGRRESPAEFAQGASRVRGVRRGERAGGVPFRRPFGIRNGDRHQQEAGARCGGRRPGSAAGHRGLMVLGSPPGHPLGLFGQRELMIIGKNRVASYFVLVDFNYA